MHSPEQIKELRAKMIDHLEKAIGAADEAGDFTTSFFIERALDSARADQWPALDPRLDVRPKPLSK